MTTPTLDAALTAYSLTRDDLPGIDDAWDAMFGALDAPVPLSPAGVLIQAHPQLNDWTHVDINEVVPRANGSLVIHVDGNRVEDDEEVYCADQLTIDGDLVRVFLRAREDADEQRQLTGLRHLAAQFAEGSKPIWWLLADVHTVAATHDNAARAQYTSTGRVDRLTEHLAQIELLQAALTTHTPISAEDAQRFGAAVGYAQGVKPLDRTGFSFSDDGAVRVGTVNDIARDLAKYAPEHARLQEALDAAHALPEGALREFLIGERPQSTYPVIQGTGRNKRTVQKTYTPTSELVKDYRTAAEGYKRAEKRRLEQEKTLRKLRREATSALKEARTSVKATTVLVEDTWSAGWPGGGKPPAALAAKSPW